MEYHVPKLITRNSQSELKIIWNDGKECLYSLRELRALCMCALCRHEITGERLVKIENIPEDINLTNIEIVGNYALSFTWTDNHSTGIYSYDYLRSLCKVSK
ncbi:MAG: hypothetical protein A3B68_04005 [Candidatus Melainabacteria bacterium RIFCSPHIGHO2_02_FULL_34_12]|nr:MAG: hypothetical protein A3B68_04005 [Candidatus Melainabacteria bacterium RIFCSPHIGHO2_02_FULL_34_12]